MARFAMISQPMADKSDEEILKQKKDAESQLKQMGYEVIDTLFTEDWSSIENMEKEGITQIPVKFLAKSIDAMAHCNAVYFCDGWKDARGCRIEHMVAVEYGLDVIHAPEKRL